jgi:hypothetical protein
MPDGKGCLRLGSWGRQATSRIANPVGPGNLHHVGKMSDCEISREDSVTIKLGSSGGQSTRDQQNRFVFNMLSKSLEAGTGIEPVFTDLQSAA